MSSGTSRPDGRQWVFFKFRGKRHTLRLGTIGEAARRKIEGRTQELIDTIEAGLELDVGLRKWLADLGDGPYATLATAGLAPPRHALTVDQLFAWHRKHLAGLKRAASTLEAFDNARENCKAKWGPDRPIRQLTIEDADALRSWMLSRGKNDGTHLARTTTSRRLAMVRQVLDEAKRRGWIETNPFAHIKRQRERNIDRDEYIPWDLVEQLLKLEKSAQFRLFLAMARICGPRCPSEMTPLPWSNVEWPLGIFRVDSPKTERYGRPHRDVPIFAELAPYLRDAWDAGQRGRLLFPDLQISLAALTDRLAVLCRRAKTVLWQKPWVNLRASAERDMLKTLPMDEATAFLGHSSKTALDHYNRVAKDLRARAEGRALHLPDLSYGVKQVTKSRKRSAALLLPVSEGIPP